MSTNLDIIEDALELLGVIADGESASAEDGAFALRKLNQMLSGWEVDGVALGYFQQSSTTDPCPIPDWAEKGVYGRLAMDMAAHFQRTLTPEAVRTADEGYELILRRVISLGMKGLDMSHLGGGSYRWNIETDL